MSRIYVGEKPVEAVMIGGKKYVARAEKKGSVPAIYQRLEYIESTGAQYVDTGMLCTTELGVSLKMQFTSIEGSMFCGAINRRGSNYCRFHCGFIGGNNWHIAIGDSSSFQIQNRPRDTDIHSLYMSSTIARFDDEEKQGIWTGLPDALTFWLFDRNSGGGYNQTPAKMKLYSCSMYKSGILVRDFVPVKNRTTNIVGLWDMVSKMFFTDGNGGNFIGGDPV